MNKNIGLIAIACLFFSFFSTASVAQTSPAVSYPAAVYPTVSMAKKPSQDYYVPNPHFVPFCNFIFPCFRNTCVATPPELCGFKLTGYLDGSYNYLVRSNEFISDVHDRVFDLEPNGFTLQQAAFTLAKQPDQGFGGLLNVIAGRDANETAAYGWDPNFGSQTLAVDPLQAYLQYATGHFVFIGGKFISLSDIEDFDPTQNTNFSRSILFGYSEPGTVLGLRGTYNANQHLDFVVGINDGWDTIRDFNKGPTLELGMDYDLTPCLSLSASNYLGQEREEEFISTGPKSTRELFNIYGTYKATNRLTLIANYVYGTQKEAILADDEEGRATWTGIAGYVNYLFNDHWRASFRGEIYDDKEGFTTGVAQTWKELTLTLAYLPFKCLELRFETRHDWSNVPSFVDSHDDNNDDEEEEQGVNNNQQSYAIEAVYKFGV